jgi:hypothetical protein
MQKYRCMPRRALLYFIDWLVIVIFLTVWMVTRKPVPTERAISYTKSTGHILVQLAKLRDLTEAKTLTVPMWTLFGDGTLIFRTDPSDSLWRAQLSLGDIQHILDVIVNQNTFFEHTTQRYGSITADKDRDNDDDNQDDDKLLLTVDADGQQKEVILMSEPTNQAAIDIQTAHVFAIERFLLAYHPLHSEFYAPSGIDS